MQLESFAKHLNTLYWEVFNDYRMLKIRIPDVIDVTFSRNGDAFEVAVNLQYVRTGFGRAMTTPEKRAATILFEDSVKRLLDGMPTDAQHLIDFTGGKFTFEPSRILSANEAVDEIASDILTDGETYAVDENLPDPVDLDDAPEGISSEAVQSVASEKERIAQLNDLARTAMGVASVVYITSGVTALGDDAMSAIREQVERFNDFGPANDPYGERDFGSFTHDELDHAYKIFWKIDYYDRESFESDMPLGSSNPADPAETLRVLTIMLAEEY